MRPARELIKRGGHSPSLPRAVTSRPFLRLSFNSLSTARAHTQILPLLRVGERIRNAYFYPTSKMTSKNSNVKGWS